MVVAPIDGVINEVPVPSELPPDDAANQLRVPALAVAPNAIVPASQREAGVVPVTDGVVLTVATTDDRGDVHPLSVDST